MKNLIKKSYITVLACSVLGMAGCDLDEYNPSGVTADAVWGSSPENFLTLVNSAYDKQRYWYGKEDGIFLSETGTDLWFNRDKRLWAGQITQYNNFDGNTGFVRNSWRELYNAINHCNAGIERIDDVEWPSETQRNSRLGELRFMRAFYYWHIVETWGGVVLRTEETKEAIQTSTRSSEEEFYDVILSDLEFAAEHLPVDQGDEYSRADKKAALGLLARCYLTRASYGDGDTYYALARDAAQEVIDRQEEFGVELWDNYADMWDPNNNKDNKEALYVISNSTNVSLNYDSKANKLHQFFLAPYSGRPGLNQSIEYGRDNGRQFMPTLALLDFYDEEKDARYYGSFQEIWIANKDYTWTEEDVARLKKDPSLVGTTMRAGIDTAMMITKKSIDDEDAAMRPYDVIDRDSVYFANGNKTIQSGNEYVVMTKYMDPITRESPSSQTGFLDLIIIRLAEMYLIAAEAEHMLNNDAATASHINVLRTRAAVKSPVDHTADMQVAAGDIDIDFILDERARELCGEHLRWFDLRRTGKLAERISQYNPDITQFQPHHVLRPISQTELDAVLNDDFQQNPGY